MSEILQHWATQVGDFADAADYALRQQAMDTALQADLPHARVESWKYTSLRSLARRQAAVLTAADSLAAALPERVAALPAPRVVFVNGQYHAAASDLGATSGIEMETLSGSAAFVPAGPANALNQVNVALSQGGVRLRITDNIEQPVHLVWLSTPEPFDGSQHNTHQVEFAGAGSATVVEHVLASAAHRHIATNRMLVNLASGANMLHVRAQLDAAEATWFARTEVSLDSDAIYRRLDLEIGSALSRHELDIQLLGDRAFAQCNGILFGNGKRHLDTRLHVTHSALNTACELTWRGLGTERSRIAFHGGILINEGADFTSASLSNKNLLLSEHAEIDTQPVLEIFADEVQAAHGATVGQLDSNALFYLRSRGIDDQTARSMLTAAFVHELLTVVQDETARGQLADALDSALASVEF